MSSIRGPGSAVPIYRQATSAEQAPPARYPSVAVSLTSDLDIYTDDSEPPPMYTNEPLEMDQTSFQSLPIHATSGKELKQAQAVGAQPPPSSDSDSDDEKKVKKMKKDKEKAEKKQKKVKSKTKAKEGANSSPRLTASTASSTTFRADRNGNVYNSILSSISEAGAGNAKPSRHIRPKRMKAAASLPASMPPPNPSGYFTGGFHPSTSGPPPAPFNVAYESSSTRQSASRVPCNAHPKHRKSKRRSNDSSSSSSSSSESSSSSDSESSSSDSESSDEDVKPSRVSYRCEPLKKGGKEKKVKEKSMSATYPFQPMAMPTMGVFMGGPPTMDLAQQISADVHAHVRKHLERSLKKSKKPKNMK